MRKLIPALILALLCVVSVGHAEMPFKALSVTATSQIYTFPRASDSVMLCNYGTNEAYFRVFNSTDTPAAATTASALLPAGTATVPYCITVEKAKTEPAAFFFVSIVCDTAETATVNLYIQ